MERIEYKVLTNNMHPFSFRPVWKDGTTRVKGRLNDILPLLGAQGWEVAAYVGGSHFPGFWFGQVVLKRRTT